MHPADLVSATARAREALKLSLGSSGDEVHDIRLWEKTMEEVSKGWLIGPYAWEDLGDHDVVSHRFPLVQGSKLRPIDDYSRSGVNACVTTLEQPTVDSVDVAACMFSNLCTGLAKNKRCSKLKGRSFDLTAAYRQLCVSMTSRGFAVLAVYNPHTKKTMLFTQVCLPFGARASVNGFIRCSRCIQWLATRCLLVPPRPTMMISLWLRRRAGGQHRANHGTFVQAAGLGLRHGRAESRRVFATCLSSGCLV